jgi:hypothetical protein
LAPELVGFGGVAQFQTRKDRHSDARYGDKEAMPPRVSPEKILDVAVQQEGNDTKFNNQSNCNYSSHCDPLSTEATGAIQ